MQELILSTRFYRITENYTANQ